MTQHVARPAPDAGGPRRTLALVRAVPVSLDVFLGADETAPVAGADETAPVAPLAPLAASTTASLELSVSGPSVRLAIRLPGEQLICDAIISAAHIDAERIEQLRALLSAPAGRAELRLHED